jgi:spore coat protein U-like protein
MMRMGCARRLPLLAGLLLLQTGAYAANCNISVPTPYAFGAYDTINNRDIAVDYSVTCTKTSAGASETVNVVVTFSVGSGTYAARTMSSGVDTLIYNIYKDAARTQIRGDGTSGTVTGTATLTMTGTTPSTATGTIYGRVFGGQDVPAGNYATTTPITVTLTF